MNDNQDTAQVELQSPPQGAGDLAPTTLAQRTWTWKDMAGLWIGMAACIPSYMLASGAVKQGMTWWQAVCVVTLGNLIVLIPIVLNAHAGTKYGIAFPVYCRASFGIRGAQIPAMLRALVACGWFGIQTWIGGAAIYIVLNAFWPGLAQWNTTIPGLGTGTIEFACFMAFWFLNIAIIWRGIDTVRFFLNTQAPILILFPLVLLVWALVKAGGLGVVLEHGSNLTSPEQKESFARLFFPILTGVVGFWATLALNIPDFSRYVRSQKDQVIGQAAGLPITMALYALVGVLVTSATIVIFGKAIWNPVDVMGQFGSPWATLIALFALTSATLTTNLAANVVGPANDIAHMAPSRISFRVGALITGVVGIVIMPWKLIADPIGYVFTWLLAYSSLLGAVCGIMLADYYPHRKRTLDLAGLYQVNGPYWYVKGINPVAVIALVVGIAPCLPGFLVAVKWLTIDPKSSGLWAGFLRVSDQLYGYAWFISLGVAGAVYLVGMAWFERTKPKQPAGPHTHSSAPAAGSPPV
jgi:nucleobase:cation symporter-1, NCS1 family